MSPYTVIFVIAVCGIAAILYLLLRPSHPSSAPVSAPHAPIDTKCTATGDTQCGPICCHGDDQCMQCADLSQHCCTKERWVQKKCKCCPPGEIAGAEECLQKCGDSYCNSTATCVEVTGDGACDSVRSLPACRHEAESTNTCRASACKEGDVAFMCVEKNQCTYDFDEAGFLPEHQQEIVTAYNLAGFEPNELGYLCKRTDKGPGCFESAILDAYSPNSTGPEVASTALTNPQLRAAVTAGGSETMEGYYCTPPNQESLQGYGVLTPSARSKGCTVADCLRTVGGRDVERVLWDHNGLCIARTCHGEGCSVLSTSGRKGSRGVPPLTEGNNLCTGIAPLTQCTTEVTDMCGTCLKDTTLLCGSDGRIEDEPPYGVDCLGNSGTCVARPVNYCEKFMPGNPKACEYPSARYKTLQECEEKKQSDGCLGRLAPPSRDDSKPSGRQALCCGPAESRDINPPPCPDGTVVYVPDGDGPVCCKTNWVTGNERTITDIEECNAGSDECPPTGVCFDAAYCALPRPLCTDNSSLTLETSDGKDRTIAGGDYCSDWGCCSHFADAPDCIVNPNPGHK